MSLGGGGGGPNFSPFHLKPPFRFFFQNKRTGHRSFIFLNK